MDPVGYPYHLKLPFGAGFVHYLLYAVVIHSGNLLKSATLISRKQLLIEILHSRIKLGRWTLLHSFERKPFKIEG